MLSHIHHINFVVKDIAKAIAYFSKLLNQQPITEELLQRKVTTARYKLGETWLVLVQPTHSSGVVADILARKGEGIFLLSFATESIDATLENLELNAANKREGLDAWEICDLSPQEQFGAILQLTQYANKNSVNKYAR
jgi:methylmalonyl-CoA/ethylmalonyl-CoA epimerase